MSNQLLKKMRRKIKGYQVDNPEFTPSVKLVSELTEHEAKYELCLAMDLIRKLLYHSHEQITEAEKYRYE